MSERSSKAAYTKISFLEGTGLLFHLGMCSLCRRFDKDMKRLTRLVRRDVQRMESDSGESMPNEAKQRIKEKLS